MSSRLNVKRGKTASWAKTNSAQDTKLAPGQLRIEYQSDGISRVKVGPDPVGHTETEWDDIPNYLSPSPRMYSESGIFYTYIGETQSYRSLSFENEGGPRAAHFGSTDFQLAYLRANDSVSLSTNNARAIFTDAGEFKPYNSAKSYSLGTSSLPWASGYLSSMYGSYVLPSTASSGTVGQSSRPWASMYANIIEAATYQPKSDSTGNVGSLNRKFGSGYINKLYTDGNIDDATNNVGKSMALSFTRVENVATSAITTPGSYMMRTGITGGFIHGGSEAVSYFSMMCMSSDTSSSYRQYLAIKEGTTDLYIKGSPTGSWKRLTVQSGTSAPSGTANVGDIYVQYS